MERSLIQIGNQLSGFVGDKDVAGLAVGAGRNLEEACALLK